ncbi:MAG: 4-hydroxy-2-oxovalerate aldolase [Candidatus Omnitrophota bacterium]
MRKINILDTTLRDGSYAINFSFTADDTAVICRELEGAGIEYIEIGHGVGLNASNAGHGVAAATDEEYMAAARRSLKKSKYGMFCIPGIANLTDLDLAADHGMDFIRIGTNVDAIEKAEPFIQKAKKSGMLVAANFMKSYALSPKEFALKVKQAESYGADIVYFVDSAGGMLPRTIDDYIHAVRKKTKVDFGFHGHNNLGLAMANTLRAAELGVRFIDASLQGLGRSSGNACTEILVAALAKCGVKTGVNFLRLLKIGQKYIQPLITKRGEAALDIVSGYAEFHSSYMPKILKCAAKYQVDPEILIIEVCKISRVDVDEEKLNVAARKISKKMKRNRSSFLDGCMLTRYVGGEQENK